MRWGKFLQHDIFILLSLSLFLITGCGSALAPSQPAVSQERVAAPSLADDSGGLAAVPTAPAAATAAPLEPHDGNLPEITGANDRMIIQTADLLARARDVQAAVAETRSLVSQYGGYVVSLNFWEEGDGVRATMSLRVPAENFDTLLDEVGSIVEKVERSSVSGQDVTEEYYDLDARLTALKATEQELLLLLTEVREKTKSAEDILAVYRELASVQSQIEQLEGRQRYLERMVAMSTVNLTLLPVDAGPAVLEEGWQPLRTARRALRTLVDTGQGLLDALIWLLLYVLPVIFVLALPFIVLIVVVRWLVKRRRSKRLAAAKTPEGSSNSPM